MSGRRISVENFCANSELFPGLRNCHPLPATLDLLPPSRSFTDVSSSLLFFFFFRFFLFYRTSKCLRDTPLRRYPLLFSFLLCRFIVFFLLSSPPSLIVFLFLRPNLPTSHSSPLIWFFFLLLAHRGDFHFQACLSALIR